MWREPPDLLSREESSRFSRSDRHVSSYAKDFGVRVLEEEIQAGSQTSGRFDQHYVLAALGGHREVSLRQKIAQIGGSFHPAGSS